MTRDEQADRVAPDRPADRSGGPGRADPAGDLSVAGSLTPSEAGYFEEHVPIPDRSIREIERWECRRWATGEERTESDRRDPEVLEASVCRGRRGRGLDLSAKAPAHPRLEARPIGEPFQRDDAAVRGGQMDGSPRPR